MIPCEYTSGKRQRLGKMTKQGNALPRYLWTEAAMHAVRIRCQANLRLIRGPRHSHTN